MEKQETELDEAERAEIEAAVRVYLGVGKKWRRDDYRIEHHGAGEERRWVVWAVHAEDEAGGAPGGGKSLQLWIDRGSKKIVRELGFG